MLALALALVLGVQLALALALALARSHPKETGLPWNMQLLQSRQMQRRLGELWCKRHSNLLGPSMGPLRLH